MPFDTFAAFLKQFLLIRKMVWRKSFKYFILGAIGVFAIIGFVLSAAFFAVKFRLTNDPGIVDLNDRYFQEIKDKYGNDENQDTSLLNMSEARLLHNIALLSKYYPANAFYIQNAYYQSKNIKETQRMLEAANIYLQNNSSYRKELSAIAEEKQQQDSLLQTRSLFEWMNISEWQDFKLAVAKDRALIDSVAMLTGVEPRMIVACLVGEQIRLFNSNREAYKKWIGPLKILSVETTFSLGVTGIKVLTAQTIEQNLKDSTSVFYLGKQYEHLLDFSTNDPAQERFNRLTSYKNHFYSYMYAALNVKQIKMQWERAGFPIDDRPEILATLFNVGFEMSQPKSNPRVGGSGIDIKGKTYSFGAVAYEFYYSGELFDLFPFKNRRFDFANA